MNTVSRCCSVAFVQKRQTSHYTQYRSTNRLDALPSLADLARIIPSRLLLRPGQLLFSQTPCRETFFLSLHTSRIKQDRPVASPISQRQSDGTIPQSFILHGTFCPCIHGSFVSGYFFSSLEHYPHDLLSHTFLFLCVAFSVICRY